MKPKYLVRPNDFHIFELDTSNSYYRPYSTKEVTGSKGNRPQASTLFTCDLLVNIHNFFPINEDEIPKYLAKNDDHTEFTLWQHRSDGHGGVKGGTYEEYLNKAK